MKRVGAMLGTGLLALWFGVFAWVEYQILTQDPLWVGPLPWSKCVPPLVGFALFYFSAWLLRRWLSPGRHCLLASAIWVLVVLLASRPLALSGQFLIFLLAALLVAEGGRWLLERLGFTAPPRWLGLLFGMGLGQYPLFAAAAGGWLSHGLCLALVVVVVVLGLLQIRRDKPYRKLWGLAELELSRAEASLVFAILLVLSYSYIAASLPQTYTDGLVYRLPYLEQLSLHGAIPAHHYLWAWLIPQPMVLQMVPGYFALGELGAAWTVLLFTICLAVVCYRFAMLVCQARAMALLVTLTILSLSMVWILTTAVYNDIGIAAYTLGGLLLVIQAARDQQPRRLVLAAALLGFAASIKINAPIVILLTLGSLLLGSSSVRRLVWTRAFALAVLVGLVVAAPWYVWVYDHTGNPFFPFLNDSFATRFATSTIFTDQARSEFGFTPTLANYLRLPWDLTFDTARFGSYPRGSFGPWLLLFAPLLLLRLCGGLLQRGLQQESWRQAACLLAGPVLAFFLTSAFLGISIFRYSLAGYMLAAIGSCYFFAAAGRGVIRGWFAGCCGVFSLLFLLLVGTRVNYQVPGGIGDDVYRGQRSRTEFIQGLTHGIEDYVNRNIAADEQLLSSLFFFVNRIDNHTYHLADADSLMGKVATRAGLDGFIRQHRIRYWIIDTARLPAYLRQLGVLDKLLSDERIVYGGGSYAVYDLRAAVLPAGRALPLLPAKWLQQQRLEVDQVRASAVAQTHPYRVMSIEAGEEFCKGQLDLGIAADSAEVIADLIFLDATGAECSRKVASASCAKGPSTLRFYAPVPAGAVQLKMIVRPWRAVDGVITLRGGVVRFLR